MIKSIFKPILILIFYLLINRCNATGLLGSVGGRAAAMGRTSACEQGLWALLNNPAGIADLQGWQGGLYYENLWMLKETAYKSGGLIKGFEGVGCFGLSVSQFGWSGQSENLLGIAYARSFGPYLAIGLRADCYWLHQGEGYPDRVEPTFMLGIQSQITEKLRLGATLFNPLSTKLNTINNDAIPVVMRLGCAYQFTDDFVGQCEVGKNSQVRGVSLGSGFEYILFHRFQLRAGAQYNPSVITFGLGYLVNRLQVDIAAQMQQTLGASLQISMEYSIP